jgi:murein DD-endopeptidase MepM/ murein hydrolase activator NlpD
MPDLACTPRGGATYGKGLPDGLPKAAFFGNYILIDADAGDCLLMAHLKQGSVLVRPGMQVAAGKLVGRVGNSGNTSGAHLHIEMLDGILEFDKLLTREFRQSGLPFGFRDVVLKHGDSRRCGDVVPEKGDIVTTRGSPADG